MTGWRLMVLLVTIQLASLVSFTNGQDVVVTYSSETGRKTNRKGRIVDWRGDVILLATNNRQREIENHEIVQVQTAWSESYLAGRQLVAERRFQEGLEKLKLALEEEPRPWAQRMVRARMVEACNAMGNHLESIRQFLLITRDDPQTRFFHLVPIPWANAASDGGLAETANGLMASSDITGRLIGASWMLGAGPEHRKSALEVLRKLANDIDPNIANLAQAQIWRVQMVTADESIAAAWADKVENMPAHLRGGPYYVLAQTRSRLGQNEQASLDYMRVPILHAELHPVVAASLFKCGRLLQDDGREEEASTVWSELKQKYPGSFWASQIPN